MSWGGPCTQWGKKRVRNEQAAAHADVAVAAQVCGALAQRLCALAPWHAARASPGPRPALPRWAGPGAPRRACHSRPKPHQPPTHWAKASSCCTFKDYGTQVVILGSLICLEQAA